MNGKQKIPPVVKAVPVLLAGCAIFFVLKELFSPRDTVTEPESAPADTGTENHGESAAAAVAPAVFQPLSVPPETKIPFSYIVSSTKDIAPVPLPLPLKRKRRQIKPEDLATIFKHGALNRTEAAAELQKRGFGHTAAYEALLPDGRFSAWLHFMPDGMITWKR